MPVIPPDDWEPVGIDELEPMAWDALRHVGNTSVVAGPGAGKTEFLAQKACYLLETGLCPPPKRILAIAFKTDAAANLRRRVEARVPLHARRFQSFTFDSFTKGLVDRFWRALPGRWHARVPYTLEPDMGFHRGVEGYLIELSGRTEAWGGGVAEIQPSAFLSEVLGSLRLPVEFDDPTNAEEFAVQSWWSDAYLDQASPRVEFAMLNRLAELVVRHNPQIRRALRLTYPVVFLDEFQDTTYAQYDFLESVFGHPDIAVIAVGDAKQSIMRWAGALPSAFDELHNDFGTEKFSLRMNYRSSEALIEVQHVVATALDRDVHRATSGNEEMIDGDACQIWQFDTEQEEAQQISDWIAADVAARGRKPSSYALLVRQKADVFEALFAGPLGRHGIAIRNDSLRVGRTTLQDLLVDETTSLVLGLIRLAVTRRNPEVWADICTTMEAVRGVDLMDDVAARHVSDEVSAFVNELRGWLRSHPPGAANAVQLCEKIIGRLDREALKRTFLSYRATNAFAIAEEALEERLSDVAEEADDWLVTCDAFQGVDGVPLMTVHKSKGLEYHTVIFLGIDDRQWWAHRPGQFDGLATFFVGLSRAEQRAMFTYCAARGDRDKVDDLYQLLRQAGVTETRLARPSGRGAGL